MNDYNIRIFCNKCKQKTKHRVIANHNTSVSFFDEHGEYDESVYGFLSEEDINQPMIEYNYSLMECFGCESISLKQTILDHTYNEDGKPQIFTNYYPPRVFRNQPKWIVQLPKPLYSLLKETYTALTTDSRRLATMGTRAILDIILTEKVGDIGSFENKLATLEEVGLISRANREYIDAALDAGNAAAHRAYNPKTETLNVLMDIIENILHAIYILPNSTETIKNETPKRVKTKRSKK